MEDRQGRGQGVSNLGVIASSALIHLGAKGAVLASAVERERVQVSLKDEPKDEMGWGKGRPEERDARAFGCPSIASRSSTLEVSTASTISLHPIQSVSPLLM
jgi:hypothetical protein